MFIKDYFSLSKKIIKKELKKSKKNTIILLLIMFILIFNLFISVSIDKSVDSYTSRVSFRTLFVISGESVSETEMVDELSKIDYVKKVLSNNQYRTGVDVLDNKDNNTDHSVFLQAGEMGMSPEVVYGKNLNSSANKELVCPTKIIFDSDIDTNFSLGKSDIIDGKELLDKTITLQYYTYDYSDSVPKVTDTIKEDFTIVGLFDGELNNDYNVCYTHSDNIEKINNIVRENIEDDGSGYASMVVIVDDLNNVSQVVKMITDKGHLASVSFKMNPFITFINMVCKIMNIVLLVSLFIIIGVFVFKYRKENSKDEHLFKTLGFTKKDIFLLYFIKNVMEILYVFLISIVLISLLYLIGMYIIKFKYVILSVFKIVYPVVQILVMLIFILIFILVLNFILAFFRNESDNNV